MDATIGSLWQDFLDLCQDTQGSASVPSVAALPREQAISGPSAREEQLLQITQEVKPTLGGTHTGQVPFDQALVLCFVQRACN